MTQDPPTILVVEDEHTIAEILADYLRQAGFRPLHMDDGAQALQHVRHDPPDLILLDVMLPGLDGLAMCREIRKFSRVPVIMVSARAEEEDRLVGLELGADDYVCKPFSPREVVARVISVLRRTSPQPAPESKPLPRPVILINDDSQRITINGQYLDLTPTQFRLLRLLASHPGRVYSRSQILDLAYDQDQDVSDRIIDTHIKNIRRKIAAILPDIEAIHAVYGVGYRFEV